MALASYHRKRSRSINESLAPRFFSLFGEYPWSNSVDGVYKLLIGFGFIDRGVSGGIDDDIWAKALNTIAYLSGVRKVKLCAIRSKYVTHLPKHWIELPANLAALTRQKDLRTHIVPNGTTHDHSKISACSSN